MERGSWLSYLSTRVAVTAQSFIHDVAGDQDGDAALCEATKQHPEFLTQCWVEPDGGFIKHDELEFAE